MPAWELSKDIELLIEFLRIRTANGHEFPKDLNSFIIQCRKSALLHRMLSGKDPLPIPPPLSHSYPWYQLIEDGIGHPHDVWKPVSLKHNITVYPSIIIDQSPWKVIKELAEDEWIVTYPYGAHDEQGIPQFANENWHVYSIGTRIYPEMPLSRRTELSNKLWEIKKLE